MAITVSSISIYPVKSMRGLSLQSSDIDLIGLKGDRRWLVVDANGKFKTIREHATLGQIDAVYSDGALRLTHQTQGAILIPTADHSASESTVSIWRSEVTARHASSEADVFLSRIFDQPLRLVYLHDVKARGVNPKFSSPEDRVSFADGYPILLTSESSLRDLESRAGLQFDARRFRSNVIIKGASPWSEDNWKRIQIGSTTFRIARPCGRCIVTTLNPDTNEKSPVNEPLATLAKFHRAADGEIIFGQNLIPDGEGRIAIGDEVKVLEAGASNLL